MRTTSSFFTTAAYLCLAALTSTTYAKSEPLITSNKFDNDLINILYLDDSNVVLGHDIRARTVWRSADAGATWDKVDTHGAAGNSWDLWPHPWDNQRAYIIGADKDHWMTKNQGKTWTTFRPGSDAPSFRSPFSFHGRDPKKVIWNGENCNFITCADVPVVTEDDFESTQPLGKNMRTCYWATSTPTFAESISKKVDGRVICLKQGVLSPFSEDNRLVISDDYFDKNEVEPALDRGRVVSGIISMAAVQNFVVAAASSRGTDELALYVTDDSNIWHRAIFGQHRVAEDAYTILESTKYSMQIDVMDSRPGNPMGYLFTSNSNGTYFTMNIEHTNRNKHGRVDFEKVANIQGIVLVNVVENSKEVLKDASADKKIQSKISFDDGRTFQDLKADGKTLHLHSVTDAKQAGRVFSSPAPGIVMGVGNTGDSLKSYEDGNLYVSDDAGVTWRKALDGPHLYEFGNYGAVLIAVRDEKSTDKIQYSLDHGKNWKDSQLKQDISATLLTTVPDSTTLNFLLKGSSGARDDKKWFTFKIDFEGLHERKCTKNDFDIWPARVDSDNKPTCLMGHKQSFRRRKADADCVVDDEFKDPVPESENCVCTEADFECDYNFVRSEDRKKCEPAAKLTPPEGACKDPQDTFKGSSGWRLIPGNTCDRKNGASLDKPVERKCSDSVSPPASGDVVVDRKLFESETLEEWFYLARSDTSQGNDGTIVVKTSDKIYLTRTHGKEWKPILENKHINKIIPNPYYHDIVVFLPDPEQSNKAYYTIDRGDHFDSFELPKKVAKVDIPIKFHPRHKDWMLFTAQAGSSGRTDVYLTRDRGDHWRTVARYAENCDFVPQKEDKLILCEQREDEDPDKSMQLVASADFFDTTDIKFPNILHYRMMAEFIIVATREKESLKIEASVDGNTFAAAQFPKNFQVEHQQAYTVLDSSTHAVFLHVTVNPDEGREFGSIIKSNSNGTSYVLTLHNVNRDKPGYADFEKMQGLEGVAMVNVVSNPEAVSKKEAQKLLKSMITHNDGAQWAYIPPPQKDSDNHNHECVSNDNMATNDCSLHLHSYTERRDRSATFSSPSAVGLMLAVGNVGQYLLPKDSDQTSTFITRDAGITWKAVKKGAYLWEYGDQGSVILVVPDFKPTKSVFYTLNEGEDWIEYKFSDDEVQVSALTTVPSDTSFNFLLWANEKGSKGFVAINIDFSQLKARQRPCEVNDDKPETKDYKFWSPKHPMQDDNCLFGHIAQYHRKKPNAECVNGKRVDHLHSVARNCSCTRQDYECDYNFEIRADGTCTLVEGEEPPNHELRCKENPDQLEYFDPTGYRRIPLTTCEGGDQLDQLVARPCPGKEEEFQRKHGLSGAGLFFAIVIPVVAAGGVGYWMFDQYQKRGFGGFGQIRLGESLGSTSRGDSPFITIPVALIAGIVAIAKALPLLVSSLARSARGYMPLSSGSRGSGIGPYRSRDSFANRRSDFADNAYDDDDELLGAVDDDADADEV